MRKTPCAGRVELFANALVFSTQAMFQHVIVDKMAPSETFQVNKMVEVGRC